MKGQKQKTEAKTDLYAVLGISPEATEEEIKRAYRTLARRFHPDSATDVASGTRFLEIKEAYQVLGDATRRRAYDRRRAERGFSPKTALTWDIEASAEELLSLSEEQALYLLVEIRPAGGARAQRLPLNLCLVIDSSTSMQGDRMDYVKSAAHQIIDDLEQQDVVGIVSFSDRADVLLPSQTVGDGVRAHAQVASVWASGGTELLQGLKAGLEELNRFNRDEVVSHLILLTDGRTYGDEDECIARARRAGLARIGVSALGIGEDWNDTFLDDLVHQASGICTYISNPQQVRSVLQDQVRGLGALFARNLSLVLRFGENAWLETAFRTAPYVERLQHDKGVLNLGMLQAGAPVRVLLETVVAATPPGRQRLLQLELSAEVPSLKRDERLVFDFEPEFAVEPEKKPVPVSIVNTLSRLSIFRMQEHAWQALEDGKREEARRRLEVVATRLLDVGEKELARMALLEAGRVAQGGRVSEKGHKTLKYGTRGLI